MIITANTLEQTLYKRFTL